MARFLAGSDEVLPYLVVDRGILGGEWGSCVQCAAAVISATTERAAPTGSSAPVMGLPTTM